MRKIVKIAGRVFIGILFLLLSLVFVVLTTFYFELLNSSFLFSSFERNHAYEKVPGALAATLPNDPNIPEEERGDYANIAKNIPPHVVKETIETNLVPILDFIHGRSEDIVITISVKDLNIPGLTEDIHWSLQSMNNLESVNRGQFVYGVGPKILLAWIAVLLLLIGLLFLYGKLLQPKKLLGGSAMLFVAGGFVLVVSLVSKFFLIQMGRDLVKGPEPSQALLGILASSLLADITTTWIVMGGILVLLGFVVKKL